MMRFTNKEDKEEVAGATGCGNCGHRYHAANATWRRYPKLAEEPGGEDSAAA